MLLRGYLCLQRYLKIYIVSYSRLYRIEIKMKMVQNSIPVSELPLDPPSALLLFVTLLLLLEHPKTH